MGIPFCYNLGDEALLIQLGPWTVRHIRYDDIAEIQQGWTLWNEHWCNIWPFRYITIRRKSGLFKNFLINPSDREGFIRQIQFRIGSTGR